MNPSTFFIAVALAALAAVAILVFAIRKKERENRLTPLAGLGFACVIAGILFSDQRVIGYGLTGLGILLAVMDILIKAGRK